MIHGFSGREESQRVVLGRLAPQPGDDRGLGPPLDGDELVACHGAAAHRGRVLGNRRGWPLGPVGVAGVEAVATDRWIEGKGKVAVRPCGLIR
jgi:hypothetical protein